MFMKWVLVDKASITKVKPLHLTSVEQIFLTSVSVNKMKPQELILLVI